MKQITSSQNPYIKSLVLLQEKSKARKKSGTFLIEGQREIELAQKGGFVIETILFLPDLISQKQITQITNQAHDIIEISKEVYQN